MDNRHIRIISGSANPALAKEVAGHLKVPLTPVTIKKFSDGELYVQIQESVRGSHCFIFQPTSPPVNDHLMELLLLIDAARRASAKEITVVMPYMGYSRHDRKTEPREPISARLVANMIEKAGANRVVTFDLHVDQIQGFFDIPSDNLEILPLLADYIINKKLSNVVVVSPDAGGTKRARRLAKLLNASIALIDKRRPRHGEAEVLNVVGEIQGKTAILLDDIIDTAGTISAAATAVKKDGAKDVYICATHAIFSGNAVEKLANNDIKEILVFNTIALDQKKRLSKIKVMSVGKVLAESIKRIYEGAPMGVMLDNLYSKLKKK